MRAEWSPLRIVEVTMTEEEALGIYTYLLDTSISTAHSEAQTVKNFIEGFYNLGIRTGRYWS